MSLETRSTSALFKRAEQLKRWQESETSKESTEPGSKRARRIQFTDGCVFLASCAASDRDEVDRLIRRGADIDTANVDGLTALHQVSKLYINMYITSSIIIFICYGNNFTSYLQQIGVYRRQS